MITISASVPSGSDGIRTIYALVHDSAGNYSALTSASIVIDTQGPAGSIDIPAAASATTGHVITVGASDPNFISANLEMRLSGDISNHGAWETFDANPLVFLTVGDALKTVNVEFRDPLGNVGSLYSDTTTLDMSAPVIAITTPVDSSTSIMPPLLAGTASDASVGVASVDVAIFDGSMYWDGLAFGSLSVVYLPAAGTNSWSYAELLTATLTDGTYIVDAAATDLVGNASGVTTHTFYIDQTPPSCTICLVLHCGSDVVRGVGS
jgi:hypothetical protein